MTRKCMLRGLVALVVAFQAASLPGQNTNTAEIRGTVTDATGAAVPRVTVTVGNVDTGTTVTTSTGETGTYVAPALPLGRYTVTFARDGFKKSVHSGLELHVGATSLNVTLEIGAINQEVSIQAVSPLIQTETAAHETSLASSFVAELPQVSWSWQSTIAMLPGISAPTGPGGRTGVSFNGTQTYQSAWLLDGNSITQPVSQNPSMIGNAQMELIAEVNISLNNMTAQYGGGTSVFNVISKSGTNQFHGSLFEWVQNDKLNAKRMFAATKPYARWNMYGGSLGGPILRNKAFFFVAVQRNPSIGYSAGNTTYPTAAMKAGDFTAEGFPVIYDPNSTTMVNGVPTRTPFSGNRIPGNSFDPVTTKIQDYIPTSQLSTLANNYNFFRRSNAHTNYISEKIDYNLSSKHRLTFTGTLANTYSFSPDERAPMNTTEQPGREQHYRLTEVATLSPTTLAELHFSALRTFYLPVPANLGLGFPQKLGLKNAAADLFPDINISGTLGTGIGAGTRALFYEGSWVPSGTMTLIRGRHNIKLGGEYDRFYQNYTTSWPDLSAGNFNFTGIATRNPAVATSTGVGYADFLLGQVANYNVRNPPLMGQHSGNYQFFIQDDYKMRPNLTIQFGLRQQIQMGWSEQYDRVGTFDRDLINPATGTKGAMWFAPSNGRRALQKTLWKNFAPRVGVAWSPARLWSVRAGYGLFDFLWGGNTYTYNAFGLGLSVQGQAQTLDNYTPAFTMAQGPPPLLYPTNASRTPDMLNGQNIAHYFYDTPMPYTQQMQVSVQRQLPGGSSIDVAYVRTWTVHQAFTTDGNQVKELGSGRRPYPQFNQILTYWFNGTSNYHSMQISYRKQFSHGLNIMTNYTWSKAMDTGTGSGWGSGGSGTYQYAYDQYANYALSNNYMPHMLNGGVVWEIPVGAGRVFLNRRGLLDYILGGWQASSIFQMRSGTPITPTMATNLSGAGSGSWFPNRIGSGKLENPTLDRWFDINAFVQPAPNTFGNSGRNILYGPAWRNMDFNLAKSFRLPFGEDTRLQIRMDSTNVLNHPNFNNPNASIGSTNAGRINSASDARIIQLGARLSF